MALDTELQQLTAALGWALVQWAAVEDALGHVFGVIVAGNASRLPAKAAMDATINFNAKLAMAQAAAHFGLRAGEKGRWTTLRNRLSAKGKSRNELAHFTIVETSPPHKDGRTYSLSPHLGDLDVLIKYAGTQPMYSRDQIIAKGESFRMLKGDLTRFLAELREARAAT